MVELLRIVFVSEIVLYWHIILCEHSCEFKTHKKILFSGGKTKMFLIGGRRFFK